MSSLQHEEDQSRINFLEKQLEITRRELNNLRQQLKSLNFIHQKECNRIKEKLENWRCTGCRSNNNQQSQNSQTEDEGAVALTPTPLALKQIGTINTDFPEKRGTPRQAVICSNLLAKLTLNNEIFTNPTHSLEGLQEFSHMWILFYFHRNESNHVKAKVAPPRLNGIRTGIFATRSPHRPSPIGLSLVKINQIIGNNIFFNGADMIDGTPVIDIKPYIPHYDNPVMINLIESGTSVQQIGSQNLDNFQGRVMDGEDSNTEQPLSGPMNDERFYMGLTSRIGEREAPDGEEEEPPATVVRPVSVTNETSENHIRVPSWIQDSPVSSLSVTFKEKALFQLHQLGAEGEEKKKIITNILREDPRSIYLREKWGSDSYVFRISELYVSCKFNDVSHIVTVSQIFQNIDPELAD